MRIISVWIFVVVVFCSCSGATPKENSSSDTPVEDDSVVMKYSGGVTYLGNSTDVYEILCQEWIHIEDAETLADVDPESSLSLSIRTFHLFNDNTCIKNYRNEWAYGTWKYNEADKIIELNYTSDKDIYKIASIATDELNIVNKKLNTSTILQFTGSEKKLKDISDEPFHIKNNQWRINPRQKETDAQIKQRLRDNLYFFILFYRSSIAKYDKTISFYGLPGCLKWYGGGIYLQDIKELSDEWTNCFYSKEQAMKAYKLMEKVMEKKYTWPKENIGWVKKNLFVLEQMVKNLDAMPDNTP